MTTFRNERQLYEPFQDLDEISKPSPFMPAHFKCLNLQPNEEQQSKTDKSIKDEDLLAPNFLEALFTFLETDEEYIANQGDIDKILKLFNQYYNIKEDTELDRINSF